MIQSDHNPYPSAVLSHPGMSGKNNEDYFAVTAFRFSAKDPTPVLLAVLSDGIGGHRAGETASEMAVQIITRQVVKSSGSNPLQALRQAVIAASVEIHTLGSAALDRQGMGATCAVVWIIGNRLYTIAIGDSRIYLMRGTSIQQLTTDHTWIQEALTAGVLRPEEANGHPNAHVIRRYLGSPTPPEGDLRLRLSRAESDAQALANQGLGLHAGDRLLLCSDGLTDLVLDAEILTGFLSQPLQAAAQALVDLANQRGGHDNITLIAIEIPQSAVKPHRSFIWRKLGLGCMAALALGIAGAATAGLVWFLLRSGAF